MQQSNDVNMEDIEDSLEITQEDIEAVEYSKIEEIASKVDVKKVSDITGSELKTIKKGFDCGIEEYNTFLRYVKKYDNLNISKTHLLIDKDDGTLIGYMSLNSDTIRLEDEEKKGHNLEKVRFKSIPALKIGKLATSKNPKYRGKGYGTFLIEIAHLVVDKLNEMGVACRFITVDADVQYHKNTYKYYEHHGFTVNQSLEYEEQLKNRHLVSMRKDIFEDYEIVHEDIRTTS